MAIRRYKRYRGSATPFRDCVAAKAIGPMPSPEASRAHDDPHARRSPQMLTRACAGVGSVGRPSHLRNVPDGTGIAVEVVPATVSDPGSDPLLSGAERPTRGKDPGRALYPRPRRRGRVVPGVVKTAAKAHPANSG